MNMKRPFTTTLFADCLLVLFTVSCSSEDKEFDYASIADVGTAVCKAIFCWCIIQPCGKGER